MSSAKERASSKIRWALFGTPLDGHGNVDDDGLYAIAARMSESADKRSIKSIIDLLESAKKDCDSKTEEEVSDD